MCRPRYWLDENGEAISRRHETSPPGLHRPQTEGNRISRSTRPSSIVHPQRLSHYIDSGRLIPTASSRRPSPPPSALLDIPTDDFGFAIDERLDGILAKDSPPMPKAEPQLEASQTVDPSTLAHGGHYDMVDDSMLNQGNLDGKPPGSQSDELPASLPPSQEGTTGTTPSDAPISTPCCSGPMPIRQIEPAQRDRRASRPFTNMTSSSFSNGDAGLHEWNFGSAQSPQENNAPTHSSSFAQSHSYPEVLLDSSSYAHISRQMNDVTLPIRGSCNGMQRNESSQSGQATSRCVCGDECECLNCPEHIYNQTTRNNVRDLSQIMADDLPRTRPASMQENMFSAIEQSNGFQMPFSPFSMANNMHQGESQRSGAQFQDPSSQDYYLVQYQMDPYHMQCAQPDGTCPCGPDCTCTNCLTHSSFQPHDMHQGLQSGYSQAPNSSMFPPPQAEDEQHGPSHPRN